MEITIRIDSLKAALCFAAKKDIRYYLNGACIETGAFGAVLIATDGHTLCVHRIDDTPRPASSIIVPREALETVAKSKTALAMFAFDPLDGEQIHGRTITITAGHVLSVSEIDGKFPDWRRVIRAKQTGEWAAYNPEFVATVNKAGQFLRKNRYGYLIRPNGSSVGCSVLADDFHAFIMPLRGAISDMPSTTDTWSQTI